MVEQLLKFMNIFLEVDGNNNRALELAIEYNNAAIVQKLLEFTNVLNNIPTRFIISAIRSTTGIAILKMITAWLKLPDNISPSLIRSIFTSLYFSSHSPYACILERTSLLLTTYKVLRENITIGGNILLDHAISKHHMPMVYFLLAQQDVRNNIAGGNNRCLHSAVLTGNEFIMNLLLKFPAVVSDIAIDNNAILSTIAKIGNKKLVEFFLDKYQPVLINIAAGNNKVLNSAIEGMHKHIVELLLQYPAVCKELIENGYTSLRLALSTGGQRNIKRNIEMAKLLLKLPGVGNNIALKGNAILWHAIWRGNIRTVKFLLKDKKVTNAIDPHKDHCLGLAIRCGNINIVKKLLKFTTIDLGNLDFYCCYLEEANNQLKMLKYFFKKYKQMASIIAERGNKVLMSAAHNLELEVVELLLSYKEIKNKAAINDNAVLTASVDSLFKDYSNWEKQKKIMQLLMECPGVIKGIAKNNNQVFAKAALVINPAAMEFLLKNKEVLKNIATADNEALYNFNRKAYEKSQRYYSYDYKFSKQVMKLFLSNEDVCNNIAAKDDRILRTYCADDEVNIDNLKAILEIYMAKGFPTPEDIKNHKNILAGKKAMNHKFKKIACRVDDCLWQNFAIPRDVASLIFIYTPHLKDTKNQSAFFDPNVDESIYKLYKFWTTEELGFLRKKKQPKQVIKP